MANARRPNLAKSHDIMIGRAMEAKWCDTAIFSAKQETTRIPRMPLKELNIFYLTPVFVKVTAGYWEF
jgi:hypothetical protein